MINAKIGAFFLAAFIAGAFVASPELRAYAADTIGSADIINESILSEDIKNGQVMGVDLASNAVTSTKISPGAVVNGKLGTNAVTSNKILDGQVMTADIANGNVTNSKLAANSVDTNKILDGQILSQDIQDGGVTGADLAFNTVGAEDIAADSVGASELQGVTVLGFGQCSIDPPDIGGTDEAGQGRKTWTTLSCKLPDHTTRVIAYPITNLPSGLVPCGSYPNGVGAPGPTLIVCIQNVFDTTNVDSDPRLWSWIAFA